MSDDKDKPMTMRQEYKARLNELNKKFAVEGEIKPYYFFEEVRRGRVQVHWIETSLVRAIERMREWTESCGPGELVDDWPGRYRIATYYMYEAAVQT